MLKFMFERWGSLRPEWKMSPDGVYYMPLFLGLWVSIPKPASGLTGRAVDGAFCPSCDTDIIDNHCEKCGSWLLTPRH